MANELTFDGTVSVGSRVQVTAPIADLVLASVFVFGTPLACVLLGLGLADSTSWFVPVLLLLAGLGFSIAFGKYFLRRIRQPQLEVLD